MAKRDEAREGPSQRQLRVGEEIRRVLARVFERGELHEPALSGVRITLSEVSVSPDLRNATVWVIPPIDGEIADILPILSRVAGRLSGQVAREVRMKFAPRLTFKRDTAFDASQRMNAILNDPVIRQDVAAAPESSDEDSTEDGGSDTHGA
ncbi:30S ribosome-binding factor RbfA [Thalassobaculum sp. OXR-137]|uniref:30S ribosome-binding factor RbfA n=1 Tax=Thalassobaculum sp. OXR-137 TaxID=3100173 RepID=UPI002AC94B8D|nr:30S ribosome-binding factor RbfA [Thalassobaculum sp. OXR-137]WPZ35602.1 30S ribosome-binding factor RbfA [Thalassobaculum sp. OXR-137]